MLSQLWKFKKDVLTIVAPLLIGIFLFVFSKFLITHEIERGVRLFSFNLQDNIITISFFAIPATLMVSFIASLYLFYKIKFQAVGMQRHKIAPLFKIFFILLGCIYTLGSLFHLKHKIFYNVDFYIFTAVPILYLGSSVLFFILYFFESSRDKRKDIIRQLLQLLIAFLVMYVVLAGQLCYEAATMKIMIGGDTIIEYAQ